MELLEMQKEIYDNKVRKGFNTTDIPKEFCLLYGEVAEAFEAWKKKQDNLGEELADVAIYLMGLAEILGINLQEEIENKMSINRSRTYVVENGVMKRTSSR